MSSVRTTTVVVNGAAAEAAQVVSVPDNTRKYIGLYAKVGTCKISLGEGVHADIYMNLAQGNLFELAVNTWDKVTYSGTGTVLHVIQDMASHVSLTSDLLTAWFILTYNGVTMTYSTALNGSHNNYGRLPRPVFKQ